MKYLKLLSMNTFLVIFFIVSFIPSSYSSNLIGCSLTREELRIHSKVGDLFFKKNPIRCLAKLVNGQLGSTILFKNKHGTLLARGKIHHRIGQYSAIHFDKLIYNVTSSDFAVIKRPEKNDFWSASRYFD